MSDFSHLPEFLEVQIQTPSMDAPGTIKAAGKTTSNNKWLYEGGVRRGLVVGDLDESTPQELLAQTQVWYNGTPMKMGDIHVSKERKDKDGKTYGGGNWTVTFTTVATLQHDVPHTEALKMLANGDELPSTNYLVNVTFTYLGVKTVKGEQVDKQFAVYVKAFKQGGGFAAKPTVLGEVEGLVLA